MALQRLAKGMLLQSRFSCQKIEINQCVFLSQCSLLHTSTNLRRELTEGTSTRESSLSGFQKLRQNVTNLITGTQKSAENKENDNVDRSHSPEAHPLPDERAGSIYVQAQWQDGGVIHDVKPHGQGISLSSTERAARQGEKDMASA